MICPKSLEKYPGKQIAFHPCGTGPYILKDYNPSEILHVVKNPNYWQKGLPKLDSIYFKPVPENSTRVAMLRRSTVHLPGSARTGQDLDWQRQP